MFWDFFDDWDPDPEDFAWFGGSWGLVEEEMDEEEKLRRELEREPDDDLYL